MSYKFILGKLSLSSFTEMCLVQSVHLGVSVHV